MARALAAIVCQHLTVARVAEGLGVAWNTANDAVLAEGYRVLINDPARFVKSLNSLLLGRAAQGGGSGLIL